MMMKNVPLAARMWLNFLMLRKTVFTEADMTEEELQQLRGYIKGEINNNMYLSFGNVDVVDNIVSDVYDFEPVAEMKTATDVLVTLSSLYHKFGYKGYEVKIKL
jgi:hypothetical protein